MVHELTPPEAASFGPDIWDSDPSGRCGARDLVADALSRSLALKGAASHSGRRTFITKAAKRCIEGVAACGTFSSLPGMKSFHDAALHRGSSDAAFSRQIYSPT